jgi:hypothetical protein
VSDFEVTIRFESPAPSGGSAVHALYTLAMTLDKILASIDSEIAHLERARVLLSGRATKKTATRVVRKKHKLSAAGRKRIAEGQRKRWAKQKAVA